MPRDCGSGSSLKAQVRNRLSDHTNTGIRTMLRTDRFSVCVSVLALLVLLIGLPTAMYAQNTDDDVHIKPRMEPKPPSDGIKELEKDFSPHTRPLKSTVELVLVPVTITDPMNRLVTGLDKENFTVFEGKSQQEIKSFSSEDAPVSLGVIFDMSGSMSSKIERAREAVLEFFKTANPQDEFFMITFADKPEEVSDFTSSIEDIQGKLVYTVPKGRTALLDAIYLGVNKMRHDHLRWRRQPQPLYRGGDQVDGERG